MSFFRNNIKTAFFYTFSAVLVLLFIFSAARLSSLNDDYRTQDQAAYMAHVRQIHAEDDHIYFGDRNRMPLYNYIQAIFYSPGMSEAEHFEVGKAVNIFLSLAGLVAIFFVLQHWVFKNRWYSLVTVGLMGLGVIIFHAATLKVEALFYLAFLICILAMLWYLQHNSLRNALFVAVVAAITYLLKGTPLPVFYLFLVFVVLQGLLTKNRKKTIAAARNALIAFVTFILILSPYLISNINKFGTPFYNVNTTFYVWYEDWEAVKQGTRAYEDRTGWPNMPAEDIPSFSWYRQQPDWASKALNRFLDGGQFLIGEFLVPGFSNVSNSFSAVLILLLAYVSFLSLRVKDKALDWLKRNWLTVLFIFGYNFGLFLSFCWYVPIAGPPAYRFLHTLFLPVILALIYALYRLRNVRVVELTGQEVKAKDFNWLVILVSLLATIVSLVARLS